MPRKKSKAYLISSLPRIRIGETQIPQRGVCEIWKYLGIIFSGAKVLVSKCSIYEDLVKLTAAPRKPQQWMLIHSLVLLTKRQLERIYQYIRDFVRKWLLLPKDKPLGYFYVTVKEGGLGQKWKTFDRWNVCRYESLLYCNNTLVWGNSVSIVVQSSLASRYKWVCIEWLISDRGSWPN